MRPLMTITGVVWLLVLFFALSNPMVALKKDSAGYMAMAHNLWTNHVFSASTALPFAPDTVRLPGYPLFLGFFSSLLHVPLRGLIFIHWILGVSAVLLCWKWMSIINPTPNNAARFLFACDLIILMHTFLIMTEALFLLMLVWTCIVTYQSLGDLRQTSAAQAGLLWGLLLLIKPVTILLAPLLSILFFKKPRVRFLVFLSLAYLPAALWSLRNVNETGHFFLSSQGGIDLLRYPASSVEALRLHKKRSDVEMELRSRIDTIHAREYSDFAAQSREYGHAAMHIMQMHSVLTLRYCFYGALRLLCGTGLEMIPELVAPSFKFEPGDQSNNADISGVGMLSLLKRLPVLIPVQLLYMGMLGTLYVFYFNGLWNLWKLGQKRQALFLLIGPLYFVAVSCHQGYYRYRIPLMPFLAAGASLFHAKRHDWRRRA